MSRSYVIHMLVDLVTKCKANNTIMKVLITQHGQLIQSHMDARTKIQNNCTLWLAHCIYSIKSSG